MDFSGWRFCYALCLLYVAASISVWTFVHIKNRVVAPHATMDPWDRLSFGAAPQLSVTREHYDSNQIIPDDAEVIYGAAVEDPRLKEHHTGFDI